MNSIISPILQPYLEGKSCIILNGRSLDDLALDTHSGKIRPLIEILRREALVNHNLFIVQYSRSRGVVYGKQDLSQPEIASVEKQLRLLQIVNNQAHNNLAGGDDTDNSTSFAKVIRALTQLSENPQPVIMRDGKPLRFMVIFEFSEHITQAFRPEYPTHEQILGIEMAIRMANNLQVRKSGNYCIFSEARTGLMDNLLYQNIPTVTLPQPLKEEKISFIEKLRDHYSNFTTEDGLTDEVIANLSSNTPNRSLESMALSSEKTGKVIGAAEVFERKQADIIALSEGTLEPVDPNRIKGQTLVGLTIERPLEILKRMAELLKSGSVSTLRNILLAGAPATGKTMLANFAAANAGVPAFNLNSPKGSYVGESERKTKLMLTLMKQQGGFGIIDELELTFPMNRNVGGNDSGVTQNLMGQLQNFLSDASLAGKCVLVGTSNRPNEISDAMLSRWTVVPVLQPVASDYVLILESIAKGINPNFRITDKHVFEQAAQKFHLSFCSPRVMREALISSTAIIPELLSMEHIVFAANDIIPNGNNISAIYSDYCAIAYCRNMSFLPWWDIQKGEPMKNFPFPDYIKKILNDDLTVNYDLLKQEMDSLAPFSNV